MWITFGRLQAWLFSFKGKIIKTQWNIFCDIDIIYPTHLFFMPISSAICYLILVNTNKQTTLCFGIPVANVVCVPAWHTYPQFATERWNLLHHFGRGGFFYKTYKKCWLSTWNQPSSINNVDIYSKMILIVKYLLNYSSDKPI